MSPVAERQASRELEMLLIGKKACHPDVRGALREEFMEAKQALDEGHKAHAIHVLRNITFRNLLDVHPILLGKAELVLDLLSPQPRRVCNTGVILGDCTGSPSPDDAFSLES